MGYSPFKMAPKSPMLKALKGNQNKLPQQLQDAIEAAPESPAKQVKEPYQRQMGPLDKYNPHKPGSAESKKYRKDYNIQHQEAQVGKEKAGFPAPKVSKTKTSPAKQTKEYSDKGTKLRAKAEKASAKGRDKKAVKLNTKADKYDKKQVLGLMGSLEKSGAFDTKSPAKNYKKGYYGV